ncbi:hypothetical protein [Sphingobacterium bambusae]|uniref:Uncharacterized protein n=1 Tax=Sphingobacterium bambusae TaxID=662858 RepID=A0ABW6BAH4_9SPHI|nr:hypothetical protein [Sphingobacterium bambusae]WPL48539.1 hypothetical protein SCB77_21555 [Sphingobacterium bambusae]
MDNTELFKWLAIFSPVVSGIILGVVSHKLSNRSKRIEILFQHKLRAFNELHNILINYRFELEPNIYNNPFLTRSIDAKESVQTLNLLNNSLVHNSIFLNRESRTAVMDITAKINSFCRFEKQDFENINPYIDMVAEVNRVIDILIQRP